MLEKRYQIFTSNGKEWSKWFISTGTPEKWQLKGKLLNEYRIVELINGERVVTKFIGTPNL